MTELKVVELFAGIGAWNAALKRLKIPHEVVEAIEFDEKTMNTYNTINGTNFIPRDITTLDEKDIPDCDMICYSPPCQAFSRAGKEKGFEDDRGVLFFDALRIIKEKKPKYALMENVEGLTQKKFKEEFNIMLEELEKIGYKNYWKILNAKDYGIPQNRKRVFIVSIREDVPIEFEFPEPTNSNIVLKEILEEVDEEWYINDPDKIKKINDTIVFKKNYVQYDLSGKGHNSQDQRAYYENGTHGTIPSSNGASKCKVILQEDAELPILHNIYGGFKEKKPREFYEYSPTIRTAAGGGHIPSVVTTDESLVEKEINGYRIRTLTPLEVYRLMGFDDEDIHKILSMKHSKKQLYQMAGNSIVVNVCEAIFKKLLK